MLHAGKIMPIDKQATMWLLIFCAQQIGNKTELSEKTAQAPNRLSQEKQRLFLEKKEPHHRPNAKDEKHPVQLIGTIDKIHGQRKVRTMLGPQAIFVKSLSKHNTWTLCK